MNIQIKDAQNQAGIGQGGWGVDKDTVRSKAFEITNQVYLLGEFTLQQKTFTVMK